MTDTRYDNSQLDELAATATVELHAAMTVDEFVGAVLRCWNDDEQLRDQTVTRMGETIVRFARRLAATGIDTIDAIDTGACVGFIDAPTRTGTQATNATRHARRVALRALFRTGRNLGVLTTDPTLDVALPARTSLTARPLTDDELTLCRSAVQPNTATNLVRPAAWALAEATAATSEIPEIRRRDLDHDHGTPTAVTLPGTPRLRARTVELTDWGAAILTRRLVEIDTAPNALLAYTGSCPSRSVARQAAACNLITAVLRACGLANESDVRPASVRHWRARTAFDAGASIETVATLLGHRRLDEAAEAIAHDWAPT
ncbi:tyrosine-type recombinase/integrase [Dermatobacter hominis]|uniref:tyrosine-type recombinase/integrase n=1 Tax=Dermatobacter hominis TaxID=2884263 RepID=UPI001D0F8C36|nr:hypothetical protein [Dermatobacter hominis]UDY34029.1 hypothetical protein LH044_11805 [Dermatobacter hominis]